MKFIITENKLSKVIQRAIDMELNNLKALKESGKEIPDDISNSTWEDISSVKKMTVSNIVESKFRKTPEIYYTVIVDVVYDSVTGIELDSISYDMAYQVKKTLGLSYLGFQLGEEINRYKEYGQW